VADSDDLPTQPGAEPDVAAAPEAVTTVDPELLQASAAAVEPVTVQPSPSVYKWQALRSKYFATRYPLVAVALILLVLTVPYVTSSIVAVVSRFPTAGTVALILWAAYAFPLIWLVNRFDFFEREPTTLLAMGLAWGGIIASSMAVLANQAVFSLFTSLFGEGFTERWGAALAAPTTEELLKAVGIIAVILLALRGIRSAIDGFVVGAMVGLGFQVAENFVYTGNLLLATGDAISPLRTVLDVFVVRGIGAGLWSHAVYSGVVGLGLGYAFTRRDRSLGRRLSVVVAMLGVAWFMHFLWNLPPLVEGGGPLTSVGKGVIILALLAIVVLRNQRRESYIYTDYLESLQDPDLATDAEIEHLRTYGSREAAVQEAGRRGGEKVADAVRELQRAQADLSVALATGDMAAVARAKRRIERARARRAEAELLPPDLGYRWGVASIWMSIIGVLVPVIGPLVAAILAWIGTHEAHSRGAGTASTLRAAWPVAGMSFVAGLVLLLVI
jgi:RsiW-degrading membrane proteinase PrsW (M82 family)